MTSIRNLLAFSLPLLLVVGCPDAEGEYEAFRDRHEKIHPPGTGGAGGAAGAAGAAGSAGDAGTDAAVCEAPKPKEIDGDYLFSLSAVLDHQKPMLFRAKVTTEDKGGKTGMRWNLQGLNWKDRKTLVGAPFDLPAATDPAFDLGADGSFAATLPLITVVGDANPFSHTEVSAQVNLKGKFCGVQAFYCGTAGGALPDLGNLSLDGSSWTLEKVSGTAYTEPPYINCKKAKALDVGTWQ